MNLPPTPNQRPQGGEFFVPSGEEAPQQLPPTPDQQSQQHAEPAMPAARPNMPPRSATPEIGGANLVVDRHPVTGQLSWKERVVRGTDADGRPIIQFVSPRLEPGQTLPPLPAQAGQRPPQPPHTPRPNQPMSGQHPRYPSAPRVGQQPPVQPNWQANQQPWAPAPATPQHSDVPTPPFGSFGPQPDAEHGPRSTWSAPNYAQPAPEPEAPAQPASAEYEDGVDPGDVFAGPILVTGIPKRGSQQLRPEQVVDEQQVAVGPDGLVGAADQEVQEPEELEPKPQPAQQAEEPDTQAAKPGAQAAVERQQLIEGDDEIGDGLFPQAAEPIDFNPAPGRDRRRFRHEG